MDDVSQTLELQSLLFLLSSCYSGKSPRVREFESPVHHTLQEWLSSCIPYFVSIVIDSSSLGNRWNFLFFLYSNYNVDKMKHLCLKRDNVILIERQP